MDETYKFQKLQVYKMALGYVEAVYTLTQVLPVVEKYNLTSQVQRAATSIALNIAEGSTGQSDLALCVPLATEPLPGTGIALLP